MEHLNNAASQTENYKITHEDLYSRVTKGSYHLNIFLLFLEVQNKQQLIFLIRKSIRERKPNSIKKLCRRLRRLYLIIKMFGANDFQQIPWSSTFLVTNPWINVMGFFNLFSNSEFRLKKNLKVSRVGLRWSHNALFSLPKTYCSCNEGKGEGTSTLRERNTTKSCMLRSGRVIILFKKKIY